MRKMTVDAYLNHVYTFLKKLVELSILVLLNIKYLIQEVRSFHCTGRYNIREMCVTHTKYVGQQAETLHCTAFSLCNL
jgi:hypothetical protein